MSFTGKYSKLAIIKITNPHELRRRILKTIPGTIVFKMYSGAIVVTASYVHNHTTCFGGQRTTFVMESFPVLSIFKLREKQNQAKTFQRHKQCLPPEEKKRKHGKSSILFFHARQK